METFWIRIYNDMEVSFLKTLNGLIDTDSPGLCPVCEKSTTRFYRHEPDPKYAEYRRFQFWVWCPACRRWASSVLTEIEHLHDYADPFSTMDSDEFNTMKYTEWLDRLDQLWEAKVLPTKFSRIFY